MYMTQDFAETMRMIVDSVELDIINYFKRCVGFVLG